MPATMGLGASKPRGSFGAFDRVPAMVVTDIARMLDAHTDKLAFAMTCRSAMDIATNEHTKHRYWTGAEIIKPIDFSFFSSAIVLDLKLEMDSLEIDLTELDVQRSPEAMNMLSVTQRNALLSRWSYYNTVGVCSDMVRYASLMAPFLIVDEQCIRHLTLVDFAMPSVINGLPLVPSFSRLESLTIQYHRIQLGHELLGLPELKRLILIGPGGFSRGSFKLTVLPHTLESLRVSNLKYTGQNFSSKLGHLKHLCLSKTFTFLGDLSHCTFESLEYDHLYDFSTASPYDVKSLRKLSVRWLQRPFLPSEMSVLGRLPNLSELHVDSCTDTLIPPVNTLTKLVIRWGTLATGVDLANMTGLRHLEIKYTRMHDVTGLSTLTNLEHLTLDRMYTHELKRTFVGDVWGDIRGLTQLVHLSLLSCALDIDMHAFESFKSLAYLNVGRNFLYNPSPLRHIRNLFL